jgi:hypothetical protein
MNGEHDMIHDESDSMMKGETLNDGIYFEQTANFLKYACPKTTPQLALKEVKENGKVVAYEVPKNLIYFTARQKLADGSTVTLLRYKPIAHEVRVEFHRLATIAQKAGQLPVSTARLLPLSESGKVKEAPRKVTFESLQ